MNEEKFLFRRQYILGSHFVDRFTSWKKVQLDNSIFLTVHPELDVEQVCHDGKSIVLLGYMLDPFDPDLSNFQIIDKIIRQSTSIDDVFEHMGKTGGRYVVILNYKGNKRIFSDAAGLRQVFYVRDSSGALWCAPQPGILNEELHLVPNEEVMKNFMNTAAVQEEEQWSYPLEITPFEEMHHLLPNHYLDFNTGKSVRYWPNKEQESLTLDECVQKSTKILEGLINAAHNRFKLACGVTSGHDTRTLVSIIRKFGDDIVYYTQTHKFLTKKGMDIVIARKLLKKLGLKYEVKSGFSKEVDEDFVRLFKRNINPGRPAFVEPSYSCYKWNVPERVIVNGNVVDIAKSHFFLPDGEVLNGEKLAGFAHMKNNSFAIAQFEKWLTQTREIAEECNIEILNLFYWEQRMGNWAAFSFSEADIARETFCPFNCRLLLTTFLSIKKKYRVRPDCIFLTKLIEHFCPEALQFPVNPLSFMGKMSSIFRPALTKIRIHSKLKKFIYKLQHKLYD